MKTLVAYATKYGATEAIAARIGATLAANAHEAVVRPVRAAGDLADYDAFVVGSAVYLGHWRQEAVAFVRAHWALLAQRPVWLFSSGPLAEEPGEGSGRMPDGEPAETAQWLAALSPRDHRVFPGALDLRKLRMGDRLVRNLPTGRVLLPEGDFRQWALVDAWAAEIARDLLQVSPGPRVLAEQDGPPEQPASRPARPES